MMYFMIFGQEMFWGGEPTREGWAGEFVQEWVKITYGIEIKKKVRWSSNCFISWLILFVAHWFLQSSLEEMPMVMIDHVQDVWTWFMETGSSAWSWGSLADFPGKINRKAKKFFLWSVKTIQVQLFLSFHTHRPEMLNYEREVDSSISPLRIFRSTSSTTRKVRKRVSLLLPIRTFRRGMGADGK